MTTITDTARGGVATGDQSAEIAALRAALLNSHCPVYLDDLSVRDCIATGICGCDNAPALATSSSPGSPVVTP